MWELSLGILIFASTYTLLKIAEVLKVDDENPTQSIITNSLKLLLIMIAFAIVIVGIGAIPDVIDLSIDNTDSNALTDVKTVSDVLYRGQMYTLIPILFFMLIILLVMTFTFFTGQKNKKKRRET